MPRSALFAYWSTYSSEGVQPLCSSRVKNKEEKIRLYNKKNHGGQNRYNRFYASWAGIISWISVVTTISLSFDWCRFWFEFRNSFFDFVRFFFFLYLEVASFWLFFDSCWSFENPFLVLFSFLFSLVVSVGATISLSFDYFSILIEFRKYFFRFIFVFL